RDIRHQDKDEQKDKKRARANFSKPFRTVQLFPVAKVDDSHNRHKSLLHQHQSKKIPHCLIAKSKTDSNCSMGQFICQRIQKFSKFCDHMESSCHLSVKEICDR